MSAMFYTYRRFAWRMGDALEIDAIVYDPVSGIEEPTDDAQLADYWCVFVRLGEGGREAIVDVDTLTDALYEASVIRAVAYYTQGVVLA